VKKLHLPLPHNVPNIINVQSLPTREDFTQIISYKICSKCDKHIWFILDYRMNRECSAGMLRCRKCLEDEHVFFTTRKLSSIDIIVVLSNQKHIQPENYTAKCNRCNSGTIKCKLKAPSDYNLQRIFPTFIQCDKCSDTTACIFLERPKYYSDMVDDVVKEIAESCPRAAVVFIISKAEAYLQKTFALQGDFYRSLVAAKKYSFQNLDDARKAFQEAFNIDIRSCMPARDWDSLVAAGKQRNGIIHNSGLDHTYDVVSIDSTRVNKIYDTVNHSIERWSKLFVQHGLL
jgi:hypothetical protein